MKLSIIILNWNTKDLLKQAIQSIYKETNGFDFEIIVADNGSTDGSKEMITTEFPQVVPLDNKTNLGFAKGNNAGLKVAKGDYLMLLNSDVIVSDQAINKLVDYLDNNKNINLAGPRLLNKDGSFQDSCRRRLPNPWNSFIYLSGLSFLFGQNNSYRPKNIGNEQEIGEAEAISGAAMIFRRQVYDQLGGLDE
ncbi:MAG: glycosyltransferase family 2 protein, partial [bacterium]